MEPVFVAVVLVLLVGNCILLAWFGLRKPKAQSLDGISEQIRNSLVPQYELLRSELTRARGESATAAREHRQEIANSFQLLSDNVLTRIAGSGQTQSDRLDRFSNQLTSASNMIDTKLDSNWQRTEALLHSAAADARDLQTSFRGEVTASLDSLSRRTDDRIDQATNTQKTALEQSAARTSDDFEKLRLAVETKLISIQSDTSARLDLVRNSVDTRLSTATQSLADSVAKLSKSTADGAENLRNTVETRLTAIQNENSTRLDQIRNTVEAKVSATTKSLTDAMVHFSKTAAEGSENLRWAVDEKLTSIQKDNNSKLEEMRRTVDEKLQSTLEQRLGESFRIVSSQLEQVHAGLGEMRTLASGVGDLKRVLSNIRARGNWGEVQLGALLEQMLTPDQYSRNVRTNPDSGERVEYAIKLPGQDGGCDPVWLPIDSKFPHQDYERLVEAVERGDVSAVAQHADALEENVCSEAKKIREKYVHPPYTVDFAILFLPTEGLFAELLRRPGISSRTLGERIILAGPTNLAALLSSLQMGFRTLAIQKRSSEVWAVLGAVKAEFGKFGDALGAVQSKLNEASNKLDFVHKRSRVLGRKLRDVEELPIAEAEKVLDINAIDLAAVADEEIEGVQDEAPNGVSSAGSASVSTG